MSRLTGDWKKAGIFFQNLSVGMYPIAQAQLKEDGDLVLKTMIGHIDNQDLMWTPLSESTVRQKGHETIYEESGWLKGNLNVRKVKSTVVGSTIFIGASPWKTHKPSGEKFSDLMIYLEYGTDTIPPRPLIRPTWEELEPIIKENWEVLMKQITEGRVI